jgi:molybdopterin-guanine dinucleotide biosynthesis protein A
MTILGAIFAGGQARRFRGDKALAEIAGRPLIAHVAERLAMQCDRVAVVGRDWGGLPRIDDAPRPALGPLGALAGALVHAEVNGFAQVLTASCDIPDLPGDLAYRLAPAPAVVLGQPTLGLWEAGRATALLAWLEADRDRAMRGWIAECGARTVALERMPANINTPDDLANYIKT